MPDPFEVEARLSPELRARILERGRSRLRRRRLLATGGVALAAVAAAIPLAWAPGVGRTTRVTTGSVPPTSTTSLARTTMARHGRPTPATDTRNPSPESTSPSPVVPTAPPTTPPLTATPTSVAVPARQPAACRSGLSASFVSWHIRGDVGVWSIDVTSRASAPCTLSGYLGVALSLMGRPPTAVNTTQVPDPLDHGGAVPLALAPGDTAHFTMTMLENGNDCPQLLGFLLSAQGPATFTMHAAGIHFFCGRLHITPPRAGAG
jgi:hypothetical protein